MAMVLSLFESRFGLERLFGAGTSDRSSGKRKTWTGKSAPAQQPLFPTTKFPAKKKTRPFGDTPVWLQVKPQRKQPAWGFQILEDKPKNETADTDFRCPRDTPKTKRDIWPEV